MITAASHLSKNQCAVCKAQLTVHEAVRGATCAKSDCQHTALMAEMKRRADIAAAELAKHVAEVEAVVIRELGLSTATTRTAMVPSSDRDIGKLPRKRRAAFRRRLTELVAATLEADPDATPPADPDEAPDAPQFDAETSAMQDGCATCRGYCCRHGASRDAFLDVETIRRFRAAGGPQLRARDIVREYMARVPDQTVEGSCVFHGANGCTLPRRMRAAICNIYHCPGLGDISVALENAAVRTVVIVAANDRVDRWSVHHRSGDS